jgi:hemolysin activation/secretion protein
VPKRRLKLLTVGAAIAASIGLASAAAEDAQRIEERLPQAAKPAETIAPATDADVEVTYATFAPFVLKSIAVDGLTSIPLSEAEACAAPYVGQTVGPIELTSLTQCITQRYRSRDFFLSRAVVPPQEVSDGVLKIHAIEGYVAAVSPDGIDQAEADAQFAATFAERPARLATFERALLLLADRYGHRVTTSQLAADPSDPSRYTFKLAVDIDPFVWRLYGDNRGTEAHGPEQAYAWVAWNALFGAPDRLAVSLFTTPTDTSELVYADVVYSRGWGQGVLWSEIGASISRSREADSGHSNDVDRVFGRLTVPLLRSRAQSLWAGLAFDARDTKEPALPAPTVDESTRVLRGSLSYTVIEGATRIDLAIEGAQGFDTLGASTNGAPRLTRNDARPQFSKVRLDASLTHKFLDDWEMAVAGAGQLADGALVSSEEFGIGGPRYGRAYDYSEIIGDHALAGMAELRWNWRDAFGPRTNLQLYAFADTASIWNTGSAWAPGEADLSSAGAGLRLVFWPGNMLTLEAAKPLSGGPRATGDSDPRFFLTLTLGW